MLAVRLGASLPPALGQEVVHGGGHLMNAHGPLPEQHDNSRESREQRVRARERGESEGGRDSEI